MRPLAVKLLFTLYTLVTLSVLNRASGFLRHEAFVCLERPSIRAGFFSQNPYLELGRGAILTELWIFRQSASGACFYRKSLVSASHSINES
jgi:hypothetical protein